MTATTATPPHYTGRCACGAVHASITAEAVMVRQCWCRQCQQTMGGGAAHNAMFPAEAVHVTGTMASHAYVAASGNTLTAWFCANCATPVLAHSSARMHLRTLRLGFLDAGHDLAPREVIWTSEAPTYAQIDPALPRFDRQPPAPQPVPAG